MTIDKHYREEIGMTPLHIDPALYYLLTQVVLTGLSSVYLYNLMRCGSP